MRRGKVVGLVLACAAAAGITTVAAAPSATATTPSATASLGWGTAQELPGMASLDTGTGLPEFTSLSCASAGNCAAAGYYFDHAGHQQAFVATEKNGGWKPAIEIPGTAALNKGGMAAVTSVSCPSAGDCAAGGSYSPGGKDAGGYYPALSAFVVSETSGTWGKAAEVPGTAGLNVGKSASVSSVSCSSPGNCAAAGTYAPGGSAGSFANTRAFVVSETGGLWAAAVDMPGLASLNTGQDAEVEALSCPSTGNCAVGGSYYDGSATLAFVADEADGAWQAAQEITGASALDFLSCSSPGNCGGSGRSSSGSFVIDEKAGTWQAVQPVPDGAAVNSLSCASAGNCAAAGGYASGKSYQAGVIREVNGTWGKVQPVPGLAVKNVGGNAAAMAISCYAAGSCRAGGYYTDRKAAFSNQAFVASETAGTWSGAQEIPAIGVLNAGDIGHVEFMSCVDSGACAAAGVYTSASGKAGLFVVSTAPQTSSAVSLSSAKVTYGHEQSERVSVAVKAKSGGTPTGKATVTAGSAALCTITLGQGKGSCTVPATRFAPGTVTVTASYAGAPAFAPSAAAAKSFTVSKASSRTALSLSAAKVTYGHESAERIAVTVAPQHAGTPKGDITVKAAGTTVCAITLKSGRASCAMKAKQLKPGSYHLAASYPGNADFTRSVSAAKTLTVAK